MKSISILLAVGLVASARAQEACDAVAAEIPQCASSCIVSAASAVGCETGDYKCQCGDKSAAIAETALPCVVEGCGAVTGLAVQSSAAAVCGCAATAQSVPASTTAPAPEASSTSEAVESSAPTSATPEATSATPTSTVPGSTATSVTRTSNLPGSSTPSVTPPFPTTAAAGTAPSGSAPSGTKPGSSTGSAAPFPGAASAKTIGSVAVVLAGLFAAVWVL
ncbi:hypothetical protein MMC07_002810 [Pseudocyphellaria aurata]|nr:hypothetical protein [Pseudocyphellaria aurata]